MKNREPQTPANPDVHIPIEHHRAIAISNRQYGLLRYLSAAPKQTLGLEELSQLNQLTLGSFKRASRGYITETPARDGVTLTHEGREALRNFEHGDFLRSVARMKFSSFLSLDVYEEGEPGVGKSRPESKSKSRPKSKSKSKSKSVGRVVIPIRRRSKAA